MKPYEESADFYINDVQIDAVRYSDGKCYHKRKLCDPIECTCSMEGNNFTLSMSSGLSFMEFSCEMRFKDEATGKLSVQTAHLIFNETGKYLLQILFKFHSCLFSLRVSLFQKIIKAKYWKYISR